MKNNHVFVQNKKSTFAFDAGKRQRHGAVLIIPLTSAGEESHWNWVGLNNIWLPPKNNFHLLMFAQFSASWPFGLPAAQFWYVPSSWPFAHLIVIMVTMNMIINIQMIGKENKLLPRIFLLSISETDPQLLHSVSHQLDQCAVQLPVQILVIRLMVFLQ